MKHLSCIERGQPDTAVPNTDKWALLDTLTEAAEGLGLNHRTLTVLRALLSFFPDRVLPCDPGAAVVFPSNTTLSQRLNGMPESTLRRHLAALVKSGIVNRQDSANRKRFARRFGIAFGFDLSPLARAAETLRRTAHDLRERRDRTAALRARLACVRARLSESGTLAPQDPRMETARLTLRRKTGPEELQALLHQLEPLLEDPLPRNTVAEESSVRRIQNERHKQDTRKESKIVKADESTPPDTPALSDVLNWCTEYRVFFPEAPATWPGILSVSSKLSVMLGIGSSLYNRAQQLLGTRKAAVTVLCMLERSPTIRNPAAYLQELVHRSEQGKFNFRAMMTQCPRPKLSADNFVRAAGC